MFALTIRYMLQDILRCQLWLVNILTIAISILNNSFNVPLLHLVDNIICCSFLIGQFLIRVVQQSLFIGNAGENPQHEVLRYKRLETLCCLDDVTIEAITTLADGDPG